jgi:hypothetical protein
MNARTQLPGMQWLLWLRSTTLRVGVYTGVCLSCVFFSWVWVANRIPKLESFAGVRNLSAAIAIVLLMCIPVLRFRHQPLRMFVSGLTAWTLLTVTYLTAEMHFTLLENRLGSLHMFILGAACYGLVSVFQWVFLLCAETRSRHVAQSSNVTIPPPRTGAH